MGEVNIFAVRDERLVEISIAAAGVPDGYLVVRPECLRRLRDGEQADFVFAATVSNDYMLGSRTQFHLAAGEALLVAELAASSAAGIPVGETSNWGFNLADAVTIDE